MQPSLLDDDGKYSFDDRDFLTDIHKVIFAAVFNLRQMGTENFNPKVIEDYLKNRPESLAIYKTQNGASWLINAMQNADLPNFDYYYDKVKKMTLLREYDNSGVDVSFIYDPDNIFDVKKKQQQENNLDKYTLSEIADLIETRVLNVREDYIDKVNDDDSVAIGDNVMGILEELENNPEVGIEMYDGGKFNFANRIARGARLGKVYMRSAATGVGKFICRLKK